MTSEFYNPPGTYSEATEGNKVMSSDDYYSLEFSDDYLNSQAEAGAQSHRRNLGQQHQYFRTL
jgi:hypothetical protein